MAYSTGGRSSQASAAMAGAALTATWAGASGGRTRSAIDTAAATQDEEGRDHQNQELQVLASWSWSTP